MTGYAPTAQDEADYKETLGKTLCASDNLVRLPAFAVGYTHVLSLPAKTLPYADWPPDPRKWDRKKFSHLNFFSRVGIKLDPGNEILLCCWHAIAARMAVNRVVLPSPCQGKVDCRRLRKPLPADLEFSKAPFEKLGDHVEALGGLCHPWKPESKRMINYLATPARVDPLEFDLVRDFLQQIAQAVKRLVHMTKYSHPATYVAETVRRIYGDDKGGDKAAEDPWATGVAATCAAAPASSASPAGATCPHWDTWDPAPADDRWQPLVSATGPTMSTDDPGAAASDHRDTWDPFPADEPWQREAHPGAAVSDHWDTWDTAPAHRPWKSEASWSNAPAEEPWKSGPWTWMPSPWNDACWESWWDVASRHFDAPSSGREPIPAHIRADDERFAQKKAPRTIYCDRCPPETLPFSGNNVGSFLNRPTHEVKYRITAWLNGDWNATWWRVDCQRRPGETKAQAKDRLFGKRMLKKAKYRR